MSPQVIQEKRYGKYDFWGPGSQETAHDFQEVLPEWLKPDIITSLIEWKQSSASPLILIDAFSPGGFDRSLISELKTQGAWDPKTDRALAISLGDVRSEEDKAFDRENNVMLQTGNFLSQLGRKQLTDWLGEEKVTLFHAIPFAGYSSIPGQSVIKGKPELMRWDLVYQYKLLDFIYSILHPHHGTALLQTRIPQEDGDRLRELVDKSREQHIDMMIGDMHHAERKNWGALSLVKSENSPNSLPKVLLNLRNRY
jgi:hypothetical protein